MTTFLTILALLLIAYAFIIQYYLYWWNRIPTFHASEKDPTTKITVLVPARNEAENIANCLTSLIHQRYPSNLLEIILLDDHSSDDTVAVADSFITGSGKQEAESRWQVAGSRWQEAGGREQRAGSREQDAGNGERGFPSIRIVKLSELPNTLKSKAHKKSAIAYGIEIAQGDLIVTTDADCTAGPDWLRTLALFHESTGASFIVAPVTMKTERTFLSAFQAMDFAVLQGITGASVYGKFHHMCNGANLAYTKSLFKSVNGFTGIDDIASGDDMLLMHKVGEKFPQSIGYLKNENALVTTRTEPDWSSFWQQRIRWSSKAHRYQDTRITAVLACVYLFNMSLFLLLLASLFGYVWMGNNVLSLIGLTVSLILSKVLMEGAFVWTVFGYFSLRQKMLLYILSQPLHITYTVLAGLLGQFRTYHWKGRRVS